MKRNELIKTALSFHLSQPSGKLSTLIQGIWSAAVPQSNSIVKPLYSDAGSGIIFNLFGNVVIGNETLPEGVIMLPVNRKTENIVLSPGAKLAGIRFHPAFGYGVLRQHFDKPTLYLPEKDKKYNLYQLFSELQTLKDNESKVKALYQWANITLNLTDTIPHPLEKALQFIEQEKAIGQISENIELSQRQIERIFQLWLGMAPKYYQRILRVKKAICFLRLNRDISLADAAQQFGFSDQAHMTREFQTIVRITPGQV